MNLEEQLPLKPVVYLILFSLVGKERHGYGIKKEVERLSAGRLRVDPGSLYRWMAKLLEEGWVEETERRPVVESQDERRRYYRLTGLGRRLVELESTRLSRLVEAARRLDLVRDRGGV